MPVREKLADRVITQLQQRISKGDWKQGDRIPTEPELMELFDVGRSTIREAIKTLANTGVLHVQQGSGTFVKGLDHSSESLQQRLRRAELNEITHVRTLLEKEIIALAITNHTKGDIKELSAALASRQKAIASKDYTSALDGDILFHTRLAVASHNSVLADLYVGFTHVLRSHFQQRDAGDVTQFARTHVVHQQLLNAVIDKNKEAALACLEALLQGNLIK